MCILFILIRNKCIVNVFDISWLQFLCFLNNEKPSNRTQNNLTKNQHHMCTNISRTYYSSFAIYRKQNER